MEERNNDKQRKTEEEGRGRDEESSKEKGSRSDSSGQSGTDKSPGFIGSKDKEPGEQDRDPQQAGFAEQGRGAPGEGGDVERTDNFDSDVEGSAKN